MTLRYLPLHEAAERAGLSVAYLEMLEREGLIAVKRTLDDVVVISSADLDRARVSALLTEELEVNLAGAEVILRMRDDMIAMQRQFDEILSDLVDALKRGFATAPLAGESHGDEPHGGEPHGSEPHGGDPEGGAPHGGTR